MILYLQYKFSPRFFIPKCLRSGYNYYLTYEHNFTISPSTNDVFRNNYKKNV